MTSNLCVRTLRLDEDLRDAVIKKDLYGKLTLPFVVAVQVVDEHRIQKYDVMNGLFGQETITIGPNRQARNERLRNGAWISSGGSIHSTVSSVSVWSTLEPWNFRTVEPIMVHNSYAVNPLPNQAFPTGQEVVDREKGRLLEQEGVPIAEVIGLAVNWLPDD